MSDRCTHPDHPADAPNEPNYTGYTVCLHCYERFVVPYLRSRRNSSNGGDLARTEHEHRQEWKQVHDDWKGEQRREARDDDDR